MGEYVVWKKCKKDLNREADIESYNVLSLKEICKDHQVQVATPIDSSQLWFSILVLVPHACIVRKQIQKKKEVILLCKSPVIWLGNLWP